MESLVDSKCWIFQWVYQLSLQLIYHNKLQDLLVAQGTQASAVADPLRVAKKLLDNFVNYALSYSRTFATAGEDNEAFIPAKIITDWYNNTLRKAQMDPVGFFNRIMKSDEQ